MNLGKDIDAVMQTWQQEHHIIYDTELLSQAVVATVQDSLASYRDEVLAEAAKIARDIKRRELDIAQCSFDELSAINKVFVYGANRAAEHIESSMAK